uniref:Uncharacterized protein n=1 Tax=Lepeophtheirus salmonis TaxID=72036 RepID=A0A0K2UNE6_LEPSM
MLLLQNHYDCDMWEYKHKILSMTYVLNIIYYVIFHVFKNFII